LTSPTQPAPPGIGNELLMVMPASGALKITPPPQATVPAGHVTVPRVWTALCAVNVTLSTIR
jgi:hypothetical protein